MKPTPDALAAATEAAARAHWNDVRRRNPAMPEWSDIEDDKQFAAREYVSPFVAAALDAIPDHVEEAALRLDKRRVQYDAAAAELHGVGDTDGEAVQRRCSGMLTIAAKIVRTGVDNGS